MIKNSTLIVRGQVLRETSENQEDLLNANRFDVLIERDLRGVTTHRSDVLSERVYEGAPAGVIRVSWKSYALCTRARLDRDDYGLFFLRANGSEFVLVDEQFGKIPISRWQDNSQGQDPFVAIERDLKQAIRQDTGRQLIEDVRLLGSLNRPIGTGELRVLLPSSDEILERAIHLALLRLHDYSQLQAAGRLVETTPEGPSFARTKQEVAKQEAAFLRVQIGLQIALIKESRQLPILQRFTLSSDPLLRQNATYALRHLHSFSNVRFLIRLIEDPSEETRIQALRGLQELLRPGPGYGLVPGRPLKSRQRAGSHRSLASLVASRGGVEVSENETRINNLITHFSRFTNPPPSREGPAGMFR